MTQNTLSPQLGHAHLYVRTLDRSIDFYARVLGLSLTERIGDALAFLSSTAQHHTLALQALGESALPPLERSVGLYHVAFELPSTAALKEALVRLDDHGTRWQAVDHGISWAVYFDDPDGNGLELYIDRRHHPDGRKEWGGMSARLPRERIHQAAEADAVATDNS
jgi:catechol 2,3-dioxygenase